MTSLSSSKLTVKKEYVILKHATDWPPWYNQVHRYAIRKRVWQYIDLKKINILVLAPMPTAKQYLDNHYQSLLEQYKQDIDTANEAGTELPP